MAKGINRAHRRSSFEVFEEDFIRVKKGCIFISHKYEDLNAAQEVAGYITDYGFDVYLDDRDLKLQKAVNDNDSRGIVSSIKDGLNTSTHILVLVTDNTRTSWWVPYETGYAKKGEKGIASLLLKKADQFPDYLKIEKTLMGFGDLTNYLETLPQLAPIMESTIPVSERTNAQNQHRYALLNYIRE